jgi:hypothetical protein
MSTAPLPQPPKRSPSLSEVRRLLARYGRGPGRSQRFPATSTNPTPARSGVNALRRAARDR